MWERYHLGVALIALTLGAIAAVIEWLVSSRVGMAADDTDDSSDLLRRNHPMGPITVALAVASLAGVWLGVPDTEAPLAAGAALVPLAVTGWVRRRSPHLLGTATLVVVVVGAAQIGSAGAFPARMTGAAVGAVLVAPLMIGLIDAERVSRVFRPKGVATVSSVHVVVAVVGCRIIMRLSRPGAVLGALASLAIVAAAIAVARQPASAGSRSSTEGSEVRRR
ncbi:hypothetical protein BH10ACT3_BH10ACT3_10440 [soil metagenome]